MPKPQGLTFTTMSGEELLSIKKTPDTTNRNAIKATCRWAKAVSAPAEDVWDVLGCLGQEDLAQDLLDRYRSADKRR